MNQRVVLAVVLIAAVIFLTPVMFPPPPAPAPMGLDTMRVADDTSALRSASQAAPPTVGLPPGESVGAPDGAGAAGASRADSATFTTAHGRLTVSSMGGALIGAEMSDYRRLGADSSVVQLARPGEALLRFRVLAGVDTLHIDRTPLSREATSDPHGTAFTGSVRGIPVAVRWSFAPDTYEVTINGETQPVGYLARVSVSATGLPPGAYLLVDLPAGFRTTEADSATDFQHLAYAYKPVANGADLVRFSKPKPGERLIRPGPLSWAVAKSKYFLVGVLAPTEQDAFAELQVVGVPRAGKLATDGRATVVVPLRDGVAAFEAYIGPQEWRRMVAVGRSFETANPYGGWMQSVIQPFATIVMLILLWMKDVLDFNYGVTLIVFGVMIRVVLWPLNQTAMRSSLKMQRIQPELAEIQKKHAQNPEKLRAEMMRVYGEHGMSPFSALSGCLPLLIPMPVLFALFFVFQNTIEFRGVEFLWLADISQKDPLYVLPVIMAASMFLLSWIGARNAPPNPQTKMLMYFMPGMMLVILLNFAAGLNLYYAAQNLAAIPQQWLIANERAKQAPPRT